MLTEAMLLEFDRSQIVEIIPIIIGILVVLSLTIVIFRYGSLWLQARLSGAPVSLAELIGMTFRKVNAKTIVICRITAAQAGIDIETFELEKHYLAGGNVPGVVKAMIAADRAGIELTYESATAINLEGRDVLAEVEQMAEEIRQGYADNEQNASEIDN